ncbi:uncharacterized protein [Coffea arabica]|uniref:SWIM-type domain-containing protein n=1 Tax=Coffea arabica TaxID=13443 RepID=A0A6P6TV86_COFAR|nr:uncharacterized protein LOC113704596 [Coffea arabica]
MADPKFVVGRTFTCKQKLFMKACKSHGVVHQRKIKFSKNDGRRATAYCKDCSWKVSTAVMADEKTFQVKSMQGGKLIDPKKKAESLVNGEYEAQYNKLRNYCREINPGSNVFMTTVEDDEREDRFERLYICFNACKTGFLSGCKPVVGLDGCHLRGPHKGENLGTCKSSLQKSVQGFDGSLKAVDEGAFQWLLDNTTPQQWSRAYFRTSPKCDILLNNLCESFNSSILEAREWPILGDWNYEVRCMYGDRYNVNLASRTCSCRRWELNGIPCAHAMSAIALKKEPPPENFVNECYSKEAYMRAYGPIIYPLNGEHLWKDLKQGPVLPPEIIKLLGRPKKVKRREPDEPPAATTSQGQTKRLSRVDLMDYKCRKCKQKGHNSRKCPSSDDQGNVQQQAAAATSSSQPQQQTPNTINPGANKQSQPQQCETDYQPQNATPGGYK